MQRTGEFEWFCANCLQMIEVLSRHGRCPYCDSNAVDVAYRRRGPKRKCVRRSCCPLTLDLCYLVVFPFTRTGRKTPGFGGSRWGRKASFRLAAKKAPVVPSPSLLLWSAVVKLLAFFWVVGWAPRSKSAGAV